MEHAKTWKQPIQLQHAESDDKIFLKDGQRALLLHRRRDVATIVVSEDLVRFADEIPETIEVGKRKKEGVELGWLGYPNVAPASLCFFSGRTSSYLEEEQAYLIDGVAINGVSGGPVFDRYQELIGLVTAYIPNMAHTAQALPGLCLAYDIESLRKVVEEFRTMDEAKDEEMRSPDTTDPNEGGGPKGEPKPSQGASRAD